MQAIKLHTSELIGLFLKEALRKLKSCYLFRDLRTTRLALNSLPVSV